MATLPQLIEDDIQRLDEALREFITAADAAAALVIDKGGFLITHQGDSRDFDLTTRLFRYPVSYMIYSKEFDALPDFVRERVYRRLFDVLTSDPKKDDQHDKVFPRTADRHATLEILFETKPGLPAYWRKAGNS